MIEKNSAETTVADATIPDPDELDQIDVEEMNDIPLPQKVSHDFDASEEDDGNDKEDSTQGDEGIDDA